MLTKTYNAIVGKMNSVCDILVGVSMIVMLAVLTLQIVSRFIAFMPLPWSQDVLTFLLVANCFLGAGSATARGKQIRLDFFVMMMPKKVQNFMYLIADVISIVFLIIVTTQAFELATENMHVIIGSSPITFGWYYVIVGFGAVIMILNFINMVVDDAKKAFGKKTEEVSQ